MLSYQVFERVLILLVFEFTFRCQCTEHQKECYRVNDQDVCFFRPEAEYKWLTWLEAFRICRRSKATLPMIPDEATQAAFKRYMISLNLVDGDDLWMAGQLSRALNWEWLNGKPGNMKMLQDSYVQGVLTNAMDYSSDSPGNRNNYVCQFFDAACQSNETVSMSKGCLLLDSDEALNSYDARSRCVRKGGDLVVIDNRDDLQKIREVITRIRNVTKVWIGLRRQWWSWNKTEDSKAEVTYSNWLPYHGFQPNRSCMVAKMNEYKWQQESCYSSKLFVCQRDNLRIDDTLPKHLLYANSINSVAVYTAAGISSVVVAIILAVFITVLVRKRKARLRSSDITGVPTDRSYQDLQNSLRSSHQYTQLEGVANQPSEQSSDYQNASDYLGETPSPSYLDIIN